MKRLLALLIVLFVACGTEPSGQLPLAAFAVCSGGEAGALADAGIGQAGAYADAGTPFDAGQAGMPPDAGTDAGLPVDAGPPPLPAQANLLCVGQSNMGGAYAYIGTIPMAPVNAQYVEYVLPATKNINNGVIGPLAPRTPGNIFGPSLHAGLTLSPLFQHVAVAQAEADSTFATNWEPPPRGLGLWAGELLPAINAIKALSPDVSKPVVIFISMGDREIQVGGGAISSFNDAYRRLLVAIRGQFPGRTVYLLIDIVNANYAHTIALSQAQFDGVRNAQLAIAADPAFAPAQAVNFDDLPAGAPNGNPHYQPAQQVVRGQRVGGIAAMLSTP